MSRARKRMLLLAAFFAALAAIALVSFDRRGPEAPAGSFVERRASRSASRSIAEPTVRSGEVRGRVTMSSTTAVSGAIVCARSRERGDPTCVRSGADGAYAIAALRAGEYAVSALADGFAPAAFPEWFQLAPG